MTTWECPGTDGGDWVICYKDKHGKRRTIAHVYNKEAARLVTKAPEMYSLLDEARRLMVAVGESMDVPIQFDQHGWLTQHGRMCNDINGSWNGVKTDGSTDQPTTDQSDFEDSELFRAKRRAFDNPTIENLDALIEAAQAAESDLIRSHIAGEVA